MNSSILKMDSNEGKKIIESSKKKTFIQQHKYFFVNAINDYKLLTHTTSTKNVKNHIILLMKPSTMKDGKSQINYLKLTPI